MFPHIFDSEEGQDLKFIPEESDGDIKDVLRQPPIGIVDGYYGLIIDSNSLLTRSREECPVQ